MTFQHCNGFVRCKGGSIELIYITFLNARLSTLRQYPEELDPEIFYFQWPSRTKNQRIYKNFLKEGNGDHKFFRCADI